MYNSLRLGLILGAIPNWEGSGSNMTESKVLNNEAQKYSIESTTPTTTDGKCRSISRAKPLMTNADQASVRLSGRANYHDFQ